MNERVDGDPAFVLHTRPWRETSLIVDILSRHHGRLSLVARGARRAGAAVKARLLPFQPLTLSWFGRSQLRTLHTAEWQGGDLMLRGDALMCGFYLNELLLRLLPEGDAHEALFDYYALALFELDSQGEMEPVLRRFELDLLSELGYAQRLSHQADGGEIDPEARYGYEIGTGIVPATQSTTYSGRTLLAMAAGDFNQPGVLAEGKILMRTLLAHYLGDKPLATRKMLLDLHRVTHHSVLSTRN